MMRSRHTGYFHFGKDMLWVGKPEKAEEIYFLKQLALERKGYEK
jgi:hypothetical protein